MQLPKTSRNPLHGQIHSGNFKMKIEITIRSSTKDSLTTLEIENLDQGIISREVLLTIKSPLAGDQHIYVLIDDLREAINKIG